jgi:DNA repair exonuclease SbcCD ATPase subunit
MGAATELTDAKERLAEADIAIKQAEMKISDLERDRAAIRNTHRIDVEREIQAATNLANELSIALAAGQSAEMVTNDLVDSVGRGDSDLQFEIVRQSQGTSIVMAVSGTEPLQPGDLIRVKRLGSNSTPAPPNPGSENESRIRPPDPAGL